MAANLICGLFSFKTMHKFFFSQTREAILFKEAESYKEFKKSNIGRAIDSDMNTLSIAFVVQMLPLITRIETSHFLKNAI